MSAPEMPSIHPTPRQGGASAVSAVTSSGWSSLSGGRGRKWPKRQTTCTVLSRAEI